MALQRQAHLPWQQHLPLKEEGPRIDPRAALDHLLGAEDSTF